MIDGHDVRWLLNNVPSAKAVLKNFTINKGVIPINGRWVTNDLINDWRLFLVAARFRDWSELTTIVWTSPNRSFQVHGVDAGGGK